MIKISKKYISSFKDALKNEGMSFTNQRLLIFKTLFENNGHYNCDEIIKMINSSDKKISRATAYRTLDILVKYNFARKLVLDDGISRYENKYSSEHHDHMIDIETGDIIEFFNEDIEKMQDKIAYDKGYRIVKHVHQLFVKKIQK